MTDTGVLTVLTTTGSEEKARELAEGAVRARVAACAQISAPVTSVYTWEGTLQADREWQVLFKTSTVRYGDLEAYLRRAHDYDVPEIIATPVVRGGADYLAWVAAETTGTAARTHSPGAGEAVPAAPRTAAARPADETGSTDPATPAAGSAGPATPAD